MSESRPLRRSLLFFPAARPDRFAKALATGADCVCIDLEDAVAEAAKEEARAAALGLLRGAGDGAAEVVLRVNSPRTPTGLRDLLAVAESGLSALTLLLPKVASPEEVRWIDELLAPGIPALRLMAMIESARGVAAAPEIAAAPPRLAALVLGGVDLSTELGAGMEWEPLLYARSRVVHAAAAAEIDALDTVFLDVGDLERLGAEAEHAVRLGFSGKAAIHPTQIAPIHRAFTPSDEEVRRAREVVEAYERNRGGVLLLHGRLVERPVVRRAERILARARGREGT